MHTNATQRQMVERSVDRHVIEREENRRKSITFGKNICTLLIDGVTSYEKSGDRPYPHKEDEDLINVVYQYFKLQ